MTRAWRGQTVSYHDWLLQVLKEITSEDLSCESSDKKSRAKLYVCGPDAMCDELKRYCYKLDIGYKEEVFA